jgi:hypothetical protein
MQAQVKEGKAAAIATGVVAGLTAVGGMEAIEKGLHTFMEAGKQTSNLFNDLTRETRVFRS